MRPCPATGSPGCLTCRSWRWCSSTSRSSRRQAAARRRSSPSRRPSRTRSRMPAACGSGRCRWRRTAWSGRPAEPASRPGRLGRPDPLTAVLLFPRFGSRTAVRTTHSTERLCAAADRPCTAWPAHRKVRPAEPGQLAWPASSGVEERLRTQVGIVGAGPAGLLLSHLLALRGIESVVVETRSRAYCEARQRAGVLESGSVQVLREAGLAARLDRLGLEHGGIYLQFGGQRKHIDFRDLTGRTVTVYAQTEVVKDLIAARVAAGGAIEFEISDTELDAVSSDRPVLRYTSADRARHEVECDAIAGCDGFHGICRGAIPASAKTVWESGYPY